MKNRVLTLLLALLVSPAFAAEEPDLIETRFNLLAGFPDGTSSPVTMIPGTIIPDGGTLAVQTTLERSKALDRLSDQLRDAMRLGQVEVRYEQNVTLRIGGIPASLPSPGAGSNFYPRVRVLSADASRATYEIEFLSGEKSVQKMPLTVETGRRSVVGMLDGPEAPYVFLVVEPRSILDGSGTSTDPATTPPRVLTRVAPVYPEGSKGKSAVVILEATIGTDGRVKNAKVLSGDPAFHAAAKDSVVQWVFDPARHLGQPIEVSYMITILFKPE
jgi:TonB family protein